MAKVHKAIPITQLGGGNLNFTVVGGTTQPSAPAENTIWVNTDAAIGEWMVSVAQPTLRADGTALQAGDVWIKTDTKSSLAVNVAKDNILVVNVSAAYVWDGTAFVSADMQVYKDGAWAESATYIFKANTVTGWGTSWVTKNDGTASGELTGIGYGDDGCIRSESQDANMYGQAFCQDAIDVTDLNSVSVTFDEVPLLDTAKSNRKFKFGLSNKASEGVAYDNFWEVSQEMTTAAAGTYTLDTSTLTGQLYLAVRVQYGSGAFAISEIKTQ